MQSVTLFLAKDTYDVTLHDGGAVQALLKGEYDSYETYKHTFSYDKDGYLVGMVGHSERNGEEKVEIVYTDGLLTEVSVGVDEYGMGDKEAYDADTYYPSRYPNNRTNVDFNMFLLNHHPELEGDICSLLVSLRMCGKFGDACGEVECRLLKSPVSFDWSNIFSRVSTTAGLMTIEEMGFKVGIGVATGADSIYISDKFSGTIEEELLIPALNAKDLTGDEVNWSGKYLLNPYRISGRLIDLDEYPKASAYLNEHKERLAARHVAKKSPDK